jgi:hypothetical protein
MPTWHRQEQFHLPLSTLRHWNYMHDVLCTRHNLNGHHYFASTWRKQCWHSFFSVCHYKSSVSTKGLIAMSHTKSVHKRTVNLFTLCSKYTVPFFFFYERTNPYHIAPLVSPPSHVSAAPLTTTGELICTKLKTKTGLPGSALPGNNRFMLKSESSCVREPLFCAFMLKRILSIYTPEFALYHLQCNTLWLV